MESCWSWNSAAFADAAYLLEVEAWALVDD